MKETFIELNGYFFKVKHIEMFKMNLNREYSSTLSVFVKDVGELTMAYTIDIEEHISNCCFSKLVEWILSYDEKNIISYVDMACKFIDIKEIYTKKVG